jgi:molybdopterin biosynthesis enzyme
MLGRRDIWRPWVWAEAAEPVGGTTGRPDLRRCRVRREGDRWLFTTTGAQGSAILSSMGIADGLAFVPSAFSGAGAGERLPVMLLTGIGPDRPPYPE